MLAIAQISRPFSPQAITATQEVTTKLIVFAQTYFLFISNCCLVGLGLRDYGYVALSHSKSYPSVRHFFSNLYEGVKNGEIKLAQGSCFVISGVTGALSFYYPFAILQCSSTILFLFGNLLALKSNIEQYFDAVKLCESDNDEIKQRAAQLMNSAVLGILNNINYIMIPLITLFGAPVACAIFFAGIAVTTGCLKIVHDYLYLRT